MLGIYFEGLNRFSLFYITHVNYSFRYFIECPLYLLPNEHLKALGRPL